MSDNNVAAPPAQEEHSRLSELARRGQVDPRMFSEHLAKIPFAVRAGRIGFLTLWILKACENVDDFIAEAKAYWEGQRAH